MKNRVLAAGIFMVFGIWSGCGGGTSEDNTDALAYLGILEGKVWTYDVEYLTAVLDGEVEVVQIDLEYADGVEAYKVYLRQNQLLIATRWYQVTSKGLFMLGEKVVEGPSEVERTYLEPLKLIPYPLESETHQLVQSWRTTSELAQGGSETHRLDNLGKTDIEVPAGKITAYHLVRTLTVEGESTVAYYHEYFAPEKWYVQFEYPKDSVWKLRP